jgi:hypothetical protein
MRRTNLEAKDAKALVLDYIKKKKDDFSTAHYLDTYTPEIVMLEN